jgi:thiol-disulfide isomerase/thioredoxin
MNLTNHRLTLRGSRPWAALPLAASLLLLGCSGEAPDGAPDAPAEMAPAFDLEQLEGGRVELASLRGKTVIVDFWATWCPPCEFQVPELNDFVEAHRDDPDVAVYGISIDEGGSETVAKWVSEKKVQYPILLGDETLARDYGAMGFPTLVIISPDGSIDSRHVGLIDVATLEKALGRQGPAVH